MQMMQWLPSLFIIAEDGDQEMAVGSGRYVALLVFFLEHVLFFVGLSIMVMVPDVPEDVRIAVARSDYRRAQALHDERRKMQEMARAS